MVEQEREIRKIPVRKVPRGTMEAELEQRIRVFERRYEMSSAKMCQAYSLGVIRETAEIIEWLQAYHVLQWMREKETPTDGTLGTITESSMKTG